MDETNDEKFDFNRIYCSNCNDIKEIKINSNWKEKTIDISFECDHERNTQSEYKTDLIKKEELYFYCKTHKKKFNAYCEKCKKNFCEESHVVMILKILKVNMIIILRILKLKNYYLLMMKSKI